MNSVEVAPYWLVPLERVRRDDVRSFLGSGPGVYICNAPTEQWFARYGLKQMLPSTLDKKRAIFSCMAAGSRWISPTFVEEMDRPTEDWADGDILHLGYGRAAGRLAQLIQMRKLAQWLYARRREFSYFLIYNLPLPTSAAPLLARLGTDVKVLVDYQDDYTLQRTSWFKNAVERGLRRAVDGAICVNECMVASFEGRPTCVVNAFTDPVPFQSAALFDGMRLLYAGTLDAIRGADLVPTLVEALRRVLGRFTIRITGDGPLRRVIESWTFPEVQYLGLLPQPAFEREVNAADACLVLQRPDHPFSRGSYPSKIQAYARHGKPVLVLRSADGAAPW
jgi:hypothetical protein